MKLPSYALSKLAIAVAHLQQLYDGAVFEDQTDQLSMFVPPISGPWEHCTVAQDHVVDLALTQFRLIGRATEKWYRANHAAFPRAPESVRRWFGDLNRATLTNQLANDQMIIRLGKVAISDGISPPDENPVRQPFFNCQQAGGNCEGNRAWTLAGGNTVHLCPAFFKNENTKLSSILPKNTPKLSLSAGIMAHECTHSRIIMRLGPSDNVNTAGHDEVYGYDESKALAAADPDRAILNADNYKWYTQESYIQYCCSNMDTNDGKPTAEKEEICGMLWAEAAC